MISLKIKVMKGHFIFYGCTLELISSPSIKARVTSCLVTLQGARDTDGSIGGGVYRFAVCLVRWKRGNDPSAGSPTER